MLLAKLYLNADVDLNVFMKRYSEYFDFIYFSKIRKEAIKATLFFLSKMNERDEIHVRLTTGIFF